MLRKMFLVVLGLALMLTLYGCGGSDTATVTTGTSPVPTAPSSFIANATSFSWTKIDLSWAASTDDVGVEGYKIYNGTGGWIDNSVGTSYTVTGLINGTEYCYTVSAYDADGNESDSTVQVCATTQLGAQLIEADDTDVADLPQVAFDGSGKAIAIWQHRYDGSNYNIWANVYDGAGWGTPELIEITNAGTAELPQVAMDGSGKAVAVWEQWDGAHWNINANIYNGTGWGMANLIEADDTGDARYPQIAMDGSGKAVAVWHQRVGANVNIYANIYNGTGWGTAGLLDTEDLGQAQYPQVAMDGSGNAIAVWGQFNGSTTNIWANTYNGTIWGTAALIETDSGSADMPEVAMDASGNAIAVWYQTDGSNYDIWANVYNGTVWGAANLLDSEELGGAEAPHVAMDGSGKAVAVWQQWDGATANIWANIYNGTGWETAELIETGNGFAEDPRVAMDASGNAIAVWDQSGGTTFNINANIYNGTVWGTAELLETDDAGDAYSAQVATDGSGNAVAVWYQDDSSTWNIWANIFR